MYLPSLLDTIANVKFIFKHIHFPHKIIQCAYLLGRFCEKIKRAKIINLLRVFSFFRVHKCVPSVPNINYIRRMANLSVKYINFYLVSVVSSILL